MGDASPIAAFLPWLWIAVFITVCELAKALPQTKKQLAATKGNLAVTMAALGRARAERDLADEALRRAANSEPSAPPATDELGRPFALATWQPEPERKPS